MKYFVIRLRSKPFEGIEGDLGPNTDFLCQEQILAGQLFREVFKARIVIGFWVVLEDDHDQGLGSVLAFFALDSLMSQKLTRLQYTPSSQQPSPYRSGNFTAANFTCKLVHKTLVVGNGLV